MIRMQKPLRAGQHGQAMAEFVVLAVFVLSVLLLAIVSLAKLNDVRNKVLMGSRYAAWERTLWIDGNFNKPESGPPAWEDPRPTRAGTASMAPTRWRRERTISSSRRSSCAASSRPTASPCARPTAR